MGRIIGLGGGEIGRPHENGGFYPVETTSIDKEIVKATGTRRPRLLFIPTASNDSAGYYEVVKRHFSRLGCTVDVLNLLADRLSKRQIEKTILSAHAVYVGGGSTLRMMRVWRRMGVDRILKQAHDRGVVLSGLSAGAICWCTYGLSDSLWFSSGSNQLIRVRGLGLIDALLCPHYDVEEHRQEGLKQVMRNTSRVVGLALENCSAIDIKGDRFRILASKKGAKAYRSYWKHNRYVHEEIGPTKEFCHLDHLLKK